MPITVGSVQVDILPTTSRFASDLRRQLSNLPSFTVTVDADTTAARAALEDLSHHARNTVLGVDVDDAHARAALDVLARDRRMTVEANVDDGGSISRAEAGISGLMAAGLALGPALIPVAAAVSAAFAAMAATIGAGVIGAGVLALGFSGVSDAVKALGAAQSSAGKTATTSAAQQAGAAAAVQSAEASLANTRANNADAAVRAAEAVRNAQQGVLDAERSATQSVRTALAGQATAERELATAQQAARQAQLDLTAARQAAKQQLQDLTFQVQDGALAQRQAILNVEAAQEALNKTLVDPRATQQQRDQAQLTFDQAQQQLTELRVQNQRLTDQKTKADAAGIRGSTQVRAAEQNVARTRQGVADAQTRVKTAEQNVADARVKAAEQVTHAQQALTDAIRAQATEQRQAAFSISQSEAQVAAAQRQVQTASTQSSAAVTKLNEAMSNLSPAGQHFARFIFGLRGQFDGLRAAAQQGLLPGVERGIQAVLPLLPTVQRLIGNVASTLGDLFTQAGRALAGPFWRTFIDFIARNAGPMLRTMAGIIENVASGFAGLMMAFQPVVNGIGRGLLALTGRFADFGKHAGDRNSPFQRFLGYVRQVGPTVVDLLRNLAGIVGTVVVALAPLGTVILTVVDALAKFLAHLSPTVLLAVVAGVAGLVAAITGGFGAAAIAVLAVVALLTNLYEHSRVVRDFWDQHLYPILKRIADDALKGIRSGLALVNEAWDKNREKLAELGRFIVNDILPLLGPILHAAFAGLGAVIYGAIGTIGLLVGAWDGLRGAAQTLWDDIRLAFIAGVNAVIDVLNVLIRAIDVIPGVNIHTLHHVNTVYNRAGSGHSTGTRGRIALSRGGVIPGYAPGRDTVAARLSPGEGVLVPEAVRMLGPEWVYAVNRLASGGRAANPSSRGGFAEGGIVGGIWGALRSAANFGREALAHGAAWGVNAAEGVARRFAHELIPPGFFRDMADGIVHTVGSAVGTIARSIAPSTAPVVAGAIPSGRAGIIAMAQKMAAAVGWGSGQEWQSILAQINFESGWNPTAQNPTSTAYGLGQFLDSTWAGVGMSKTSDPRLQFAGYLRYVRQRYGDPLRSWAFERVHNWYDSGGMLPPGVSLAVNNTGRPEPILTSRQWDAILAMPNMAAAIGGSPGAGQAPGATYNLTTHNYHRPLTGQDAVAAINQMHALHGAPLLLGVV